MDAHTAPDHTVFASFIPLKGLVLRTLQPMQYATTSAWLRKAATLDYLAILGIWAALIASPSNWFSFDELEGAALAFAATAVFLAQPQAWGEAYHSAEPCRRCCCAWRWWASAGGTGGRSRPWRWCCRASSSN